jgi:hypothetical protein
MATNVDGSTLGRKPTSWERWLGIVLSAAIALLGFAILALVGYLIWRDRNLGSTIATMAAAGAFLLAIGCWFLYRAAFTVAAEASHGTRLAFAWAATIVSAATTIGTLLTPGARRNLFQAGAFLAIALGWLLGELRAKKTRNRVAEVKNAP